MFQALLDKEVLIPLLESVSLQVVLQLQGNTSERMHWSLGANFINLGTLFIIV